MAALLALGLTAAACSQGPSAATTSSPAGSTTASTTTDSSAPSTLPTTTEARLTGYNVGRTKFKWVDTSRDTINGTDLSAPLPGRVLWTEVLYPTLNGSAGKENPGAAPTTEGGPFPVIAFAHGFDVSPPYYSSLLDSWVKAGFIVVAPYFPDQNTTTISAVGGPQSKVGEYDELDMVNEPADIAFVLQKFFAASNAGVTPLVPNMAKEAAVGLAGQSDGGNVAGALAFGTAYSQVRGAMPPIGAVEILSGASIGPGGPTDQPGVGQPPNSEYATTSSPPLLMIQSRSDTCNWPYDAQSLFDDLTADPVHLFEVLRHASHLEPYSRFGPVNAYQQIVETVTTEFFEVELGWRSGGLSLASVEKAATVSGFSSISSSAPTFPKPPPDKWICTLPTPLKKKIQGG